MYTNMNEVPYTCRMARLAARATLAMLKLHTGKLVIELVAIKPAYNGGLPLIK